MSPKSGARKSEARENRIAKRNRRSRRGVVAAIAVLALIVGVSEWRSPDGTANAPTIESPNLLQFRAQAAVDPQEMHSTWFCAAGTSQPGGMADETLTISNVGGAKALIADVTVSVMTGVGIAPSKLEFKLAPAGNRFSASTELPSTRSIPVSTILANADPGVVVEANGGAVFVSHSVAGFADVASSSCARGGSSEWYFGGGSTVLGDEQWLALFNPFPGDAVVDLTFFTNTGIEAPGDAQGIVVAGGSRLSVPVHDLAPRRDAVATRVTTRRGRVIAEQVQILEGRKGIALLAGVPALANQWWFSGSTAAQGRTTTVSILNSGATKVSIRVDTALVGAVTLAPIDIEVPPRSVVVADVSSRVPVGTPFSWSLTKRGSGVGEALSDGVAVEAFVSQAGIEAGIAADSGSPFASSSWYLYAPDFLTGASHEVTIFNASNKQVKWSIAPLGRDAARDSLRGTVPPRGLSRRSFTLTGILRLDADGLVTVAQSSQGSRGLLLSAGIPICPSPLVGRASGVASC